MVLELCATSDAVLTRTTGHQAHALFLGLVHQVDPVLAARLHDEPNYRPFTVSPLYGGTERGKELILRAGQKCNLRITLLDGSDLWHCLAQRFLDNPNLTFQLGQASLALLRVYATPSVNHTGWSSTTDWQTLASTTASSYITLRFASPTAFSLGERKFALSPEPSYVWDSLMRSWNMYAPEVLHLDKAAMRAFVNQQTNIQDYILHTETLHFPKFIQKGFVGTCTYHIKTRNGYASKVTALAEFARYSGVGYKTTMGMGQVLSEGERARSEGVKHVREVQMRRC